MTYGQVVRAVAALALIGCQGPDINFSKDGEVPVVPNPPLLETPTKTDVIQQVVTPEVDILWVVDNSCSMSEEQQKLRENFPLFMEFFLDSGLDWHIGVTTTDTEAERGRLIRRAGYRYLDPSVSDPIGIFTEMSRLGTGGSSDERGRRATYMALTDPVKSGENNGFYRDRASLHVIVISDEPDFSANNPTRNEFINFLTSLKDDPEAVTFSSIVGPRNGCATADPGTDYIAVTEAVGGIHESICANDWAPVLEQLGLQAAGLKREYFLSEIPVDGTIEVWVVDSDFRYEGADMTDAEEGTSLVDACNPDLTCAFGFEYSKTKNSITMLDWVPNPLAKIHVKYELLSGQVGGGAF